MNREQKKIKTIVLKRNKRLIEESEITSFNKYFLTYNENKNSIVNIYVRDIESAFNRLKFKNKSKLKLKINDNDINKAFQNILEKNEQL